MNFAPLYLFYDRGTSALFRRKRKRTLTLEKDAKFLLSEHCIKFIEWARIEGVGSKEWYDQELTLLLSNCSKHFGKAFSLSLDDLPDLSAALKLSLDSNLFKHVILELRIRILTKKTFVDADVSRWVKEFALFDESVDRGKLASHSPKLEEWLELEKRKLIQDFRCLYALYRVGVGSQEKASAILRPPLPSPDDREQLAIILRAWNRGFTIEETYEKANFLKNSFRPRLRHFFTILRYLQSDYEHLPSTILTAGINDEAHIASSEPKEEAELEDHDLEEKMSEVPRTAGALGSDEPQNGGSQKWTSAQTGQITANTSLILPGNFTNVQSSDRETTLSQDLSPITGTTFAEDSAVQPGLNIKRCGGDGQIARNSPSHKNFCINSLIRSKVHQNAQLKTNNIVSQVDSTLEILNNLYESGLEGDNRLKINTQSHLTKQQSSRRDATEGRFCLPGKLTALQKQSRRRRVRFHKR